MAKNFNNYMPEDTDPEEAQRRADAWGVNIDDHVFANADEYLESDREVLTENEYGTENVFDELDNGGAPEQESIYAGHSLKEMIEVLRDAEVHNDKSTSFEVQAALQTYLEKAIEKGELTDDGALNLIDQIDRMTKASGGASSEDLPANTTDTSGGAPRAVSPENIVNLQNTAKENWAKTPNAPAATPESPVRQAYPSAEDIDAARRATGEKGASEAPEVPATSSETEPTADDKEKSKEKRMSKIRRGFNRALGWLMAEKKDNGSSEGETKTDGEAATQSATPKATSMFAGVRKSFADMSAERRAKRAARAEGEPVAVEDGEKAPEPTEADKAAAAAAVENTEIATDVRGAGKPSDDEWAPGVPGDPIPGSPEVATSASSFPEVEKAFAEAEKRAEEAEAKAQELEARQPEVAVTGENGSILTPAGEQLLRDRLQAKGEAEQAKGRLDLIKSMIEQDQQNKREVDYAQEAFAEAEKRAEEAEAKAQELEARQPEVAVTGENGSILTPAGEQLLRDKASATLRAKEARDRADDLKVRVDSSARDLVAYRQFVLSALN